MRKDIGMIIGKSLKTNKVIVEKTSTGRYQGGYAKFVNKIRQLAILL